MHGGLHHLHARKRTYDRLSPYPHPVWWKRNFDHLMYAVAILTPLSMLPQIYDLFVFQDAAGLSLITWVLLAMVKVLWVMYGIVHRTWPIAISSVFFVFFDIAVVVGILLYS